MLDQPPKPLGTGAAGEWADEDLDGFLDGFVAPAEQRWLASMHFSTPLHAAESLLVSAMLSDYTDLVRSFDSTLSLANVVRRDWLAEAEGWLSAHAPNATLWTMPSHLGFWDSPAEFNERLVTFLETGR